MAKKFLNGDRIELFEHPLVRGIVTMSWRSGFSIYRVNDDGDKTGRRYNFAKDGTVDAIITYKKDKSYGLTKLFGRGGSVECARWVEGVFSKDNLLTNIVEGEQIIFK